MGEPINRHHWDGTRTWASRGFHILVAPRPDGPFSTWARLGPLRVGWGAHCRRLTRRKIHQVMHLHNDTILVILRRRLLIMRSGRILREHATGLGSQPLNRGICRLEDGRILYGEYGSNPQRKPVRLMLSTDDGDTWQTAWQSAPGEIRHIHMVSPVTGAPDEVFLAAGDYAAEPRLLRLGLKSGACVSVGGGSQEWRLLDLIQDGPRLIWGSDCDNGENHIYELVPGDRKPRPIHPLPGPAYAACRDSGGKMYLATAIEDRHRHRACIFESTDGQAWKMTRCFEKDPLSARLFGYGIVSFPRGQEELSQLYFNLHGLRHKEKGTA